MAEGKPRLPEASTLPLVAKLQGMESVSVLSPHRVLGSPAVALWGKLVHQSLGRGDCLAPRRKVSLLRQTPGPWMATGRGSGGVRAGAPSPLLMAAPLILPLLLEEEKTHWPWKVGPQHSMATTQGPPWDPCPPPTSSGDWEPPGGLHPPLPQPWKHEAGRVCVGVGTH